MADDRKVDDYRLPVMAACRYALATLCGQPVHSAFGVSGDLATVIEVAGQPGVRVWMQVESRALAGLYEVAMGFEPDDHDVVDFLGELANQTLGPAALNLPGVEPTRLSLPRSVSREEVPEGGDSVEVSGCSMRVVVGLF
ncbi:MAG: hypothetical protein KC910_07295 [Candidatus Eremiobacteraeota bacterium]|nr:hypothetical protein [Candidatus Eremiobacteraeota bacterium]